MIVIKQDMPARPLMVRFVSTKVNVKNAWLEVVVGWMAHRQRVQLIAPDFISLATAPN